MSLLGLDVGTTGCKAIIFDLQGRILGQGYQEYPLIYPQPGWAELDSDGVWAATGQAIRAASEQAGRADPVRALAISTQGEAVTPIDRQGRALANTIVTFDSRTIPQSEWWEATLGRQAIFQISGQPLHPMYTINKIMWWKQHRPELYQQAWKFLCYGDLTSYRLGADPGIDYSMACRTMAFDLHQERWSEQILDLAGVEAGRLATPAPSGTVIGKVSRAAADELGLPVGAAIVTGGHDQPCGALGAGIIEPGVAMDATGTVECITPAFDHPVLTDAMLQYNYPCYCHVAPGMYVALAFNFTGGSLLRWYRDVLGKQERDEAEVSGLDVYHIMLGLAADGPSSVFVLPHFTVTGTPWLDNYAKGAILGLSLATSKGDLIKGMLDGITYEMRLNLDYLAEAGVQINKLRAIGGGAKSAIWLQLKANIFNRPVYVLSVSEAACLGAALLAGVAVGEYREVDQAVAATVQVTESYQPEPAQVARYQERYQIYRQIYPTLKDLVHQM